MDEHTNKYFERIVRNTYFDSYCHEFKSIPVEQKLLNLALYIHEVGDLHFAISAYKEDRSEYPLSSLVHTLLSYIEYLRTGEEPGLLSELLEEYLSEYQIITLLEEELKSRLRVEYEGTENYSIIKENYRIEIGGYHIEEYLEQPFPTKEAQLDAIFKGNLNGDFDLGD